MMTWYSIASFFINGCMLLFYVIALGLVLARLRKFPVTSKLLLMAFGLMFIVEFLYFLLPMVVPRFLSVQSMPYFWVATSVLSGAGRICAMMLFCIAAYAGRQPTAPQQFRQKSSRDSDDPYEPII